MENKLRDMNREFDLLRNVI